MSAFLAASRAEWLRLARPRRLIWGPVVGLLSAGYAWAFGAATASGLIGSPSGFYVTAAASGGVVLTCALVGALLSASAVAGDLAGGVARAALCRPVSRASWIAGRTLAFSIAVTGLFVWAELGALTAGGLRYGLRGAFDGDTPLATAGFLAGQLALAVALAAVALWAVVALGILIGTLAGRSGAAVVGVALTGAGLTALSRWPRAEPLLPLRCLTEALDRVVQLSQGIAAAHAGDGGGGALGVCLLWAIGATLLAAVALERKDILT